MTPPAYVDPELVKAKLLDKIVITSQNRANYTAHALKERFGEDPLIVSITCHTWDRPTFDFPEENILRLQFDDLNTDYNWQGYEGPEPRHLELLTLFLEDTTKPIVFHCAAGISRSSAMCVVYLSQFFEIPQAIELAQRICIKNYNDDHRDTLSFRPNERIMKFLRACKENNE